MDRTVVLGEMSVQGLLLKVAALPERMQLAVEVGARRMLISSKNKRNVAEAPDTILTAIQWQLYDSPTQWRSWPWASDSTAHRDVVTNGVGPGRLRLILTEVPIHGVHLDAGSLHDTAQNNAGPQFTTSKITES